MHLFKKKTQLTLSLSLGMALMSTVLTQALAEEEAYTKKLAPIDTNKLQERKVVQDFIQKMVKEHHLSEKELTEIFSKTEVKPKIIDLMTRPYETKPWYIYQQSFLADKKVQEGVKYWKINQETLTRAEQKYGVPAEIIIAIIGVETHYGKLKGNYKVMDALSTLAFDYPPRSKFFTDELENYLLLCKEQGFSALQFTGSYAGAMGEPQFMPSSWRKYAVDFSNSGNNDIVNNTANAIGSVANYFKQHGWKANELVIEKTSVNGNKYQEFMSKGKDPKPKYTAKELIKAGVNVSKALQKEYHGKLALVAFDDGDPLHAEYWLGFNNFYVISRYNHSSNYSMAVYQLSQKIKTAFNTQENIK